MSDLLSGLLPDFVEGKADLSQTMSGCYIHIPFCIQKCIYCDFYSKTDLLLIPDFIKALKIEIKKKSQKQDVINTIYFGGGTPSLLSINDVALLLHTIKDNFSILSDLEITFEINPGTVDFNYLKELRNIGINRLSIGVQSFNNRKLQFLKRIHTSDQAVKAIDDAKKAGFTNISMDLIYGLPFETTSIWLEDIKKAATMEPCHLSCYMLTIEHETQLYNKVKAGLINPLDNDAMSSLFKKTENVLRGFQFEHYEISSFAKGRAHRSKHNSQYWDMTQYYGFGPAAHSFDGNRRSWNHKSIKKYIKDCNSGKLPVEDFETLTLEQKKLEMIMLGLRTLEGINLKKYKTLFNIGFEKEFREIIKIVQDQSCGFMDNNRFALNLEGKTRLDNIVQIFSEQIIE